MSPKKKPSSSLKNEKTIELDFWSLGEKTFGSWPLTTDLGLISKKVERLGSTDYGGTNLVQPFEGRGAFQRNGQLDKSHSRIPLNNGEAIIPPKERDDCQGDKKNGYPSLSFGNQSEKA